MAETYSGALISTLETILKSAFKQPYLSLNRKPHNPGSAFVISLQTSDRSAQNDDGSEEMVMELRTSSGDPTTFYFGFRAVFEFTAQYSLRDASLTVFRELCGEIAPFFRAEWHGEAASDVKSHHAQPHWHFVQSPERIEGIVRTWISPSRDFTSENKNELFSGLVDCGKIHFAMASLWDRDPLAVQYYDDGKKMPSHKQVFEPNEFPKWFKGLADYIAGQIAYLVSRAPLAATPAARDFKPT